MVSKKGWSKERLQPHQRSMHTVKQMDMPAVKLDLLIKRLDEHTQEPEGSVQAIEARMTCEVCGGTDTRGLITPRPVRTS